MKKNLYNQKKDVSGWSQVSKKLKSKSWFDTAHHVFSTSPGRDLEDYSCKDDYYWKGPGGKEFCKQGYGALVADYRKEVPVKLKTTAKEIIWDKKGVKVVTNDGIMGKYNINQNVPKHHDYRNKSNLDRLLKLESELSSNMSRGEKYYRHKRGFFNMF